MNGERLEQVVSRLKDLPTLPSVVSEIVKIVDSPTTSASDLTKAISIDQALSAKVLKLVNSAFYGFPKKIETLTHAIVILGFNTVRSLALSISVLDFFSRRGARQQLNYVGFWQHSIGCSILARVIAKQAFPSIAEESFVAGLLHDIGILINDQFFPSDFSKALDLMKEQNLHLYKAEQNVLGFNHASVGRMLAEKWNLPDALLYAIAYHHDPLPSRDFYPITATIHAANVGVKVLKIGRVGDEDFVRTFHIREEARRILKLHIDFPENHREVMENLMKESEPFLEVVTGKG
ncbi:MAG: HDOD domain-containing protein [bacterium]